MSTQINDYYPIKSSVSLILRSKTDRIWETSSLKIIDYTESLDIPECYEYIQRCNVTTSTDICAYICAGESIEELLPNEYDKEIIPPLFQFYRNEISFSEMLSRLNNLCNDTKAKSGLLDGIIQKLVEITPDNYETDEELIDDVLQMISERIGEDPFDYELAKEINVPTDPIPVSEIQSVFFRCRNMGIVEVWEWDPQDDAEEFENDAETPSNSPHYKYILSKWYKYKFDHYPALQYEDQLVDGLVKIREFDDHEYVEDALASGDIEKLFSSGWWEEHEKSYSFDGHDYNYRNKFDPRYEEDDGTEEFETYKSFKKLEEYYSDPEEFEEEVERIDWDSVSSFWHIGILHDSIDYAPAEITSILLNSGYLELTDEELEYLIDYASDSGKTEHTACLLNYKNERNGAVE